MAAFSKAFLGRSAAEGSRGGRRLFLRNVAMFILNYDGLIDNFVIQDFRGEKRYESMAEVFVC